MVREDDKMPLRKVTVKPHLKRVGGKTIKVKGYSYWTDKSRRRYGDSEGKTEFHPPTVKMIRGTPVYISGYKRPIKKVSHGNRR